MVGFIISTRLPPQTIYDHHPYLHLESTCIAADVVLKKKKHRSVEINVPIISPDPVALVQSFEVGEDEPAVVIRIPASIYYLLSWWWCVCDIYVGSMVPSGDKSLLTPVNIERLLQRNLGTTTFT